MSADFPGVDIDAAHGQERTRMSDQNQPSFKGAWNQLAGYIAVEYDGRVELNRLMEAAADAYVREDNARRLYVQGDVLRDLVVCCDQYDSAKPKSVENYRKALKEAREFISAMPASPSDIQGE